MAAIGCAYNLVLVSVAAIAVFEGKRIGGTSVARFFVFIDVVSLPLLYSSAR